MRSVKYHEDALSENLSPPSSVCFSIPTMHLRAGTSGFSFREWKGAFYPERLPSKAMLGFYSERLSTVEINSSFYRMPDSEVLRAWSETVPDDFIFVLKASRRITHNTRLQATSFDTVTELWNIAGALGVNRGPILFQLPPNMKRDVPRLQAFLQALPDGLQAAFEFRHASWFDDQVYDAIRAAGHAVCVADTDDTERPPLVSTTDWGYVRLRRERYDDDALETWLETIESQRWNECFVFFKHDDVGAAPRLAERLLSLYV